MSDDEDISHILNRRVQPSVESLPSFQLKNAVSLSSLSDRKENYRNHIANESEGLPTVPQDRMLTIHRKGTLRRRQKVRREREERQEMSKQSSSSSWSSVFLFPFEVFSMFCDIGEGTIDVIAADFGSGISAFFSAMRKMVLFLAFAVVLTVVFLFVPSIIKDGIPTERIDSLITNNDSHVINYISFILGINMRTDSFLFYGSFVNGTVPNSSYELRSAYFALPFVVLLCSIILLLKMFTTAFRARYVSRSDVLHGGGSRLARLFSAWDYSVRSPRAARVKQKTILTNIRELISDMKEKNLSRWGKLKLFVQGLVVIFLSLVSAVTAFVILYYVFRQSIFYPAVTIFTSPTMTPDSLGYCLAYILLFYCVVICFKLLDYLQTYKYYKYHVAITLRNGIFVTLSIGVLAFQLFSLVYCHFSKEVNVQEKFTCYVFGMRSEHSQAAKNVTALSEGEAICWEDWISMQLYRLNMFDLYAALVFSLIFEILPRILSLLPFLKKSLTRYLDFDWALNTTLLSFSLGLFWLSIFFSPLMCAVAFCKLLALLFFKLFVIRFCCLPSELLLTKELTENLILGFLVAVKIVAVLFYCFVITDLTPSVLCGAFKGYSYYYEITQASQLGSNLVVKSIFSGAFQIVVFFVLLVIALRLRAMALGKGDVIRSLRRYITWERHECLKLNHSIAALQQLQEARQQQSHDLIRRHIGASS